jgi:Phospholipase_D-nuclease N-terminal
MTMFGLFGLFGMLFAFVTAPLILLASIFWIWMLVHAITNRGLGDGEKIAWVLVILFLHFIGAAIYFFVGRPKRWSSFPR